MELIACDISLNRAGPGQQGDSLSLRRVLVKGIAAVIPSAVIALQTENREHRQVEPVVEIRRSRRSRRSRKFALKHERTLVFADPVEIYIFVDYSKVYTFALDQTGQLYQRRRIRLGNGSEQTIWLKVADLYMTRMTNDVLKHSLLETLKLL